MNAIRTAEITRAAAGLPVRLSSSRTAANSSPIEPPATLSASAPITNGIQTAVASPMASQPRPPTSAQIRYSRRRSGWRSDSEPSQ